MVDFVGNPKRGSKSLTTLFTDLSTGQIDQWYWDFGDGYYSSERNPTHNYQHAGDYTVILRISGLSGTFYEIKSNYIQVTNNATYDTAIYPAKKSYLWGDGIVYKRDVGVEIKRVVI